MNEAVSSLHRRASISPSQTINTQLPSCPLYLFLPLQRSSYLEHFANHLFAASLLDSIRNAPNRNYCADIYTPSVSGASLDGMPVYSLPLFGPLFFGCPYIQPEFNKPKNPSTKSNGESEAKEQQTSPKETDAPKPHH